MNPSNNGTGTGWESLSKEARRLDNLIDTQLSEYETLPIPQYETNDSVIDMEFNNLNSSIEIALNSLRNTLNMMEPLSNNPSRSGSIISLRNRHEYYSGRFRSIKERRENSLYKSQLFSNVKKSAEGFGESVGNNESDSIALLLRERNSLNSTTSQTDTLLEQAMATRDSLFQQRETMTGIAGNLEKLRKKLPSTQTVMKKIKRSKNKDKIVLGTLIGVLLFFIFWFKWG